MAKFKPNEVTVYFDLDNVLALFSTRENEEEQLKKMYNLGFYLGLQPMKGAYPVIRTLLGVNVKIVSGLIESSYVEKEKIQWCRDKLGIEKENIYLCPMNGSKAELFGNLTDRDILVDDWYRYVDEWIERGGDAYLFVRKGKGTPGYKCIDSLRDVLSIVINKVDFSQDNYFYLMDEYYDLVDAERVKPVLKESFIAKVLRGIKTWRK